MHYDLTVHDCTRRRTYSRLAEVRLPSLFLLCRSRLGKPRLIALFCKELFGILD